MTLCISADSHVTEPPGTYIDRIDPSLPGPRAAPAPRRHARRRDADRQRQVARAVLAGRRGRTPDRRSPARQRQALRRAAPRRLGSGRAPRRPGPRRRRRRGHLPVGRHAAVQPPRRRLPARVLPGVQPVDRRVLRDRARPAHRRRARPRCARPQKGIARPRRDQGARSARRDAARRPAERRLRRPDVRRVLGRGRRPRAAAVVPHPHEPERHAVRADTSAARSSTASWRSSAATRTSSAR